MKEEIMINKAKLLADRQGRQFSDVLADPHAPVQELLDLVNKAGQRLSDFTVHASFPALAAVVREFEQIARVKRFFGTRNRPMTKRFRQLTGVVIRMKMEEEDCTTTQSKGYVHKMSQWYTKSEVYQPKASHPEFEIWKEAQQQMAA
jgi:hypothetical protein